MATLDSFNGDTWTFGSDASPNAAAEEKESAAAPGGYSLQRSFTDNSPLMQYAAQTSSRRDEPSTREFSGVQSYSKIQIETLTSRFMPLVGLPGTVNPTTSEWEWSKDGTAYSNSTQVKQADSYEIASTYVEPVDSHSGLTETLERLERLIDPPTQDSTRDSSLGLGEYNRYYANGGRTDTPRTSFTLDSDAASASNKYVRSHYLSLPKKLPAAISAVVRSAHADAIPNSGATQSQQRDILGYLLDFFDTGKFTYSLDAPDGNSGGNMEMIASFLKRRSGYCVHYATTLAVLARALGVPSRVVMGYLPSSSTSGGNFVVTNQQLHAWTEAYVTGIGWIPLDVTPAGAATNQSSASTDSSDDTEDDTKSSNSSKSDSSSTDSSDTSDQKETSQSAADSTSVTGAGSWSVLDLVGRIGAGTVIAVAVAALLATPALLRRRRRRVRLGVIRADSSGTVGSRVAWGRAWDEMIDTALDNGVTIPEYASEQKIASIISDALAPAAPAAHEAQKALHQAARAVESLRYSGDAESTEDDGSGHSVADAVLAVRATFVESQRLSEDDASLPSHRLKRAVRSCVNLLRRVKRSLLPASVFSRRRHRPHRPRHPRR
jgi:transglutaminase-like putative cysteine protease